MRYTEITAAAWVLFFIAIILGTGIMAADLGIEMVVGYLESVIESGRMVRY